MKKNNYYILGTYGRVKIVAMTEEYVGFIIQNTATIDPNTPITYAFKESFAEIVLADLGTNPEYSPDEPNRTF